MSKIKKGSYGYRDANRKKRVIIVIIFLAFILIQVVISRITQKESLKNFFTVMGILTVLPMANSLAPLIVVWKYKTPDNAFKIIVENYSKKGYIIYDLVLTMREQVMPLDFIILREDRMFVYCTNPKAKDELIKKSIKETLAKMDIKLTVKITRDFKSFCNDINKLTDVEITDNEYNEKVKNILKAISL